MRGDLNALWRNMFMIIIRLVAYYLSLAAPSGLFPPGSLDRPWLPSLQVPAPKPREIGERMFTVWFLKSSKFKLFQAEPFGLPSGSPAGLGCQVKPRDELRPASELTSSTSLSTSTSQRAYFHTCRTKKRACALVRVCKLFILTLSRPLRCGLTFF